MTSAPGCLSCGALCHSPSGLIAGRYRVVKRLGAGGFGAVYEAFDEEAKERLALKLLPVSEGIDPEAVERFQREATITGLLKSPAIIKIHAHGQEPLGAWWLAMELLEGETLDAYLKRRGTLSEAELLALLGPICEALKEAHEKGIIHRDLTPRNILFRSEDATSPLKLLDFGIAALRGADPLTQSNTISGTPRYMAPEQWDGLKHANAQSDVYSLAVIFFRALSGHLPFEADSAISWMKKHSTEPPRDLKEAMAGRFVSEAAYQTIMQGLSKDPRQRPADALVFLRSFAPKEPALVEQERSRATAERTMAWFFVLVLLAVLLLGFHWSPAGHPGAESGSARAIEGAARHQRTNPAHPNEARYRPQR